MPACWEDTSSHSKSATDRTPNEWTLRLKKRFSARIILHRYMGLKGWFLSMHGFELERVQLKATEAKPARREALAKTIDLLETLLAELKESQ